MQSLRSSWQKFYFDIAELAAKRSKDPHTKVGAVLVKEGCVVGIGYNGEPRNFKLDFDWKLTEKYYYVIHAEMNAVSNACRVGVNCVGTDIYVTHSPCHRCLVALIQHGVKRIFYKQIYEPDYDLSLKIAKNSDIELIQIKEELK
jgi:dCMP deaminase